MWYRDKTLLELLYASGLRLAEVQGLKLKISTLTDSYCVLQVKGIKLRLCLLVQSQRCSNEMASIYPLWNGDFVPDAQVLLLKGQSFGDAPD